MATRAPHVVIAGDDEVAYALAADLHRHGGTAILLTTTARAGRLAAGRIRGTPVLFGRARAYLRALGLDVWPDAPTINGLRVQVINDGQVVTDWSAPLTQPAVCLDQAGRLAAWRRLLTDQKVPLRIVPALTIQKLVLVADSCDLIVVTSAPSGGDLTDLFPRDPAFPPTPAARHLAIAYFDGVKPVPGNPVHLLALPGIGEIVVIPSFLADPTGRHWRACHSVLIEAVPGQPLDNHRQHDIDEHGIDEHDVSPDQVAEQVLRLLRRFAPALFQTRFRDARLADQRCTLVAAVRAAVREPIARLPVSGKLALAGGQIAVLDDPLSAQDLTAGLLFAQTTAIGILNHLGELDTAFAGAVSDMWRHGVALPARRFTAELLNPSPSLHALLCTAAHDADLARALVGAFEDPATVDTLLTQSATAPATTG